MPIANCFLASTADPVDPDDVVAAWSHRSGIASDEMTVNLVSARQGGKRYAVMAWLSLPSLWPDGDVAALSEGLAEALADVTGADLDAVQVVTSIVASGLVVEAGKALEWDQPSDQEVDHHG